MKILQEIRKKTNQNQIIKGTLILTTTGLITRLIGFYNRIFLSDLIGAKELGIYQLIFPLYLLAFTLCVFGNELALTKLISEYHAKDGRESAYRIFRVSLFYGSIKSILVAVLIWKNAGWLAKHVLNAPECENCLKIVWLGIPFMTMKGNIHGFFLGMGDSSVHGISDFIEQSAKVLGLYLLSAYFIVRKSYTADFAVWGIVIGEVLAFIYSLIRLVRYRKNFRPDTAKSIRRQTAFFIFIKETIPFTTNRFALTLLQTIESILIPTALMQFLGNATESLSVYGIFSGIAFPFIMFPATITNALSTMLMPAVSGANSKSESRHLSYMTEQSIRFCLMIGMLSAVLFYVFGREIGSLIFHSPEAGQFLYLLSYLCPFIYLSTTLASILNGLGLATLNLIQTIIATLLRILCIVALVPKIGITGYIYGLFAGYIFLTIGCICHIKRHIPVKVDCLASVFAPLCYFTLLTTPVFLLYKKSITLLPYGHRIMLILAICIVSVLGLLPCLYSSYRSKTAVHSRTSD